MVAEPVVENEVPIDFAHGLNQAQRCEIRLRIRGGRSISRTRSREAKERKKENGTCNENDGASARAIRARHNTDYIRTIIREAHILTGTLGEDRHHDQLVRAFTSGHLTQDLSVCHGRLDLLIETISSADMSKTRTLTGHT
jgi:hypothetical protein